MNRFARIAAPLLVLALAAGAAAQVREKAKFKNDAGAVVYELKSESDGAKLVDGQGQELARIKDKGDHLKVQDASGNEVARLKKKGEKLELEDGSKVLQFVVRRGPSSLAIADASGKPLATIEFTIGEARVKSAEGAQVAKVELKGDKVRLEPQHLWTKAKLKPEAVAVLALEALPLPERAALVFLLNGKSL